MTNLSRFQRFKQILLFGTCSVVLGANSAHCTGQSSAFFPALGHKSNVALLRASTIRDDLRQLVPARVQAQAQDELQTRQSIVTPNFLRGSSAFSPIESQKEPSELMDQTGVYHSVIDRTSGPSRLQSSSSMQSPAATTGDDLNTAAGHHHGHAHGKYYEYRSVPKKKTWKYGYKRGNHKHTISRDEHGQAGKHPHFKTKVKWHDAKSKGKGIHLWDYNHHDKKHYHHG